jgi:RNA polymerase-binding protein DksA
MVTKKENPFRKLLENERIRLTAEINQLAPHDVVRENLGYGNHMADDATEAFEQATGMALLHNVEDLLKEVNDALGRLDRGVYGICESCGATISAGRLEALPYVRLCMDCQQKKEQA